MPREQALFGKRFLELPGRIQHHLDDALDLPVSRDEPADVQAESPGDGGPDLLTVQRLALDLARLDHVLGQRSEMSLVTQLEAECLHPPQQ